MLTSWWQALLDLVYPPKCPACRGSVHTHLSWCKPCLQRCLRSAPLDLRQHRLSVLENCWAAAHYDGAVKKLIHQVKFHKLKNQSRYLAELLYQSPLVNSLSQDVLAIPVPLHPDRLAERGYNQVELFFQKWALGRGMVWRGDVLVRTKGTVPQWQLSLPERRKNIMDAFVITRPEVIANKSILLLDDIFTSGTTLEECAVVLQRAGATRVQGLVMASGAQ